MASTESQLVDVALNGDFPHPMSRRAFLTALSAAGVRLIDERPRTGIRGSQVAFLHPASTGGVLTEIVQPVHA